MELDRRKRLASLPFSEKIRILEKLRDRSRTIAASGLRKEAVRLQMRKVQVGRNPPGLSSGKRVGADRCTLQPGLPVALKDKVVDDLHWLAVAVAPCRNTLEWLRYCSAAVRRELVPALLKEPRGSSLLSGREVHLDAVFSLSEDLLKEVQKFNLAKWILEVDEDVLGRYVYRISASLFGETYEGQADNAERLRSLRRQGRKALRGQLPNEQRQLGHEIRRHSL